MKKSLVAVLIAVLAVCMSVCSAGSERFRQTDDEEVLSIDEAIGDNSFDFIVRLYNAVGRYIMLRNEWKEVTVPSGGWTVGTDIPEGYYSIRPVKNGAYLRIRDSHKNLVIGQGVRNESTSVGKIFLGQGYTVEIKDGSLVFAPPAGLGF